MKINEKLNTVIKDASNIYFTSDTHFGHDNIIKFCHRPFKDVEEMNSELIRRWNEKVGPDDTIFHLGDFAFGGSDIWNNILKQLNGHKILIIGNHDIKNLREGYMQYFDYVGPQLLLNIEERSVYLNHYPFLCYGGSWGSPKNAVYQLFGHVHSGPTSSGLDTERLVSLFKYQYDVGVDNNNFTPISWSEVKNKIQENV
jgi:calcineurin-like phosphoesterase family protein